MPTIHRLLLPVCLVAAACAPVYAQSEPELRDFFEGKTVLVKLDMPASQEGVDVYPDARRSIDFNQYSARVKAAGVAIRSGESVLVTKVRVKDKVQTQFKILVKIQVKIPVHINSLASLHDQQSQ